MEANSILLIQETKKTAEESISTMKKIWAKGEGKAISAMGASASLLTWWDEDKFSLRSAIENKNRLFVELKNKENQEVFWVGNIYGPTCRLRKRPFGIPWKTNVKGKNIPHVS